MATKINERIKIKTRGDNIKTAVDASTDLAGLRTEVSNLVTLLLRINRKIRKQLLFNRT